MNNIWNYNVNYTGNKRFTKSDIKDILAYNLGAKEVVLAQVSLQEVSTKHVCRGTNYISQLGRNIYSIPTLNGAVNVNYFFCRSCGKLIIDGNSIEVI